MKRLLFISTMSGSPWGGSEELWYKTALYALENGSSVIVFVFKWDPEPEPITDLKKRGARVIKLDLRLRYGRIYGLSFLWKIKIKRIKEIIHAFNPDHILVSQGTAFDTLRNTFIRDFLTNTLQNYSLLIQHNVEYGSIPNDGERNLLRHLFAKAKNLFFVAHRNATILERQLACRFNNYQIVKNPVNLNTIEYLPFPYSATLKMACVARIDCNIKGQDLLLQQLSSEVWRSRSFELALFGAGIHIQYLNELIQFYELQDKVFIKNFTNDISSVWKQYQCLILPSYSEGLPLAIAEASLCGRPSLVSDVGDNGVYIEEGVSGFVFMPGNGKSLSDALERLWNSLEQLELMGRSAYSKVQSHHDQKPGESLFRLMALK
jgi:glycosyltransferase involved in cell wall biosynthesis